MCKRIPKFVQTQAFLPPNSGVVLFRELASHARRSRPISSKSARSIRISSPAPFADKTQPSLNDVGSSHSQAFGSRSLGEPAGTRHTRFTGIDWLDRGTGRSSGSEAVVITDHNLLSDHGTQRA